MSWRIEMTGRETWSRRKEDGLLKYRTVLILAILFLIGCAPPKQRRMVINQNEFLQCEASSTIQKEMVKLINDIRRSKRRCGYKKYPVCGPVRWNSKLTRAALMHSMDMAKHDMLSHTGSDGFDVGERVEKLGYKWRSVGENISAGRETSEQVVLGWLESPGHCANMMNPSFTEIGAACFRNKSSKYGTYWTLVLASPAP